MIVNSMDVNVMKSEDADTLIRKSVAHNPVNVPLFQLSRIVSDAILMVQFI